MRISVVENIDCMIGMKRYPDSLSELQIGKAGEYLVCAELILMGYTAYLSEQGLPYDVVMDYNGRLIKIQVKTTRCAKIIPQRRAKIKAYGFNVKRCGKNNKGTHNETSCDLFALVALDTRQIGFITSKNIKSTMFFRCDEFRGKYKDETINTTPKGRYLIDLTLENCLKCL